MIFQNVWFLGPATGPVPSKPRQLQASRIGARSVTVRWREPATTNGEIQSYRIHIQAEGAKRYVGYLRHVQDEKKWEVGVRVFVGRSGMGKLYSPVGTDQLFKIDRLNQHWEVDLCPLGYWKVPKWSNLKLWGGRLQPQSSHLIHCTGHEVEHKKRIVS